jgi:hypothetical protein
MIRRNAMIRIYDAAGNVIQTHEHAGELKEPRMYEDSSNHS